MFGNDKPKMKLVDYDPNIHMPKHVEDKLNDLFFILLVLKKGEEKNISTTTGVLVKTLFNAKVSSNVRFLNTGFYLYNNGPFNKMFYSYIDELEDAGIIQKDNYDLSLTTRGLALLQPIVEELRNSNDNKYNSIQKLIEENLEASKDFYKIVNDLHDSKLLDKDEKVVKMKDRIVNGVVSEYVERVDDVIDQYKLPSKILNKIFDLEAGISQKDYVEVDTFSNVSELLATISND